MKQFALFVTTKQSACNFSGPPQEGPEIFFARFAREPGIPINICVILTLPARLLIQQAIWANARETRDSIGLKLQSVQKCSVV